ncbi:hypothetical protein RM863_12650 [Streptomyces sp. DSM 41014]|uniref:Uncharacterized protein n=1 Tax=Streptomyces hintoniae TaxID=3075521 RepID=A0ABU2UI79_9ACTN|nr:hypothetical protein [Streptomyces sp. DSM 41014]MDT0472973.1 hypothetical protein [Streptomyces sp. DSM 41014]
MSLLLRLRRLVRPGTGRRRAATPAALLRPVDALVTDTAWCSAEERPTLHAFLRLGGRVCWVCRTYTAPTIPPGGAS